MPRDFNSTNPPRPGEELNAGRLAEYLGVPYVEIEQFPAGHSNLTYLVRMGESEWVLRRPPFGSRVKSAHDMGREYRVLLPLHKIYPPAPKPLLYCEDESVLGAPFYLMERRHGLVIRKQLPDAYATSPKRCRDLSRALVDNLADLHALELQTTGLAALGKPQGYVSRQIEGWVRRWQASQTQPVPEMDSLAAWLAEHQPAESGAALIHNDYKLDNLLLDTTVRTPAIAALLDWEMATVGDPLMDLGTALAYWVEPSDDEELLAAGFSPTSHNGFFRREDFVAAYEQRSGRRVPHWEYYYAYGLFKLAVILQQIYVRWVQGLTNDSRFASLGRSVLALARQGAMTIRA
ncbi:MAG: phosphotransferase family protein [Bryobacterales bacterium]|nr:phosphotransferase family protein [Bryobacterales bacterium]